MGTFADPVANALLDAVARAVSYSVGAVWVQLHIGDPTTTGTANPAANTTRQQAVFGAPASGRAIANTIALSWVGVPQTETYSHVSVWSAASAGTLIGIDDLDAPVPVVAADTFAIQIGSLVLTL